MDFLLRIRKTKPNSLDAISRLIASDVKLEIGIISGRSLLLFAAYHLIARPRSIVFMALDSDTSLSELRQSQPGVLIITPNLEDGDFGLSILDQAHQFIGNLCSVLIVDPIRHDLRVASHSRANVVISEQELFGPTGMQDRLIMALAKGKKWRSPQVMAAIAPPESVVLPEADGIHDPITLTMREREIAVMLMTADSELLIAEIMMLSYATVRSHSQALRRKFGVSSRRQLVLKLLEAGFEGCTHSP